MDIYIYTRRVRVSCPVERSIVGSWLNVESCASIETIPGSGHGSCLLSVLILDAVWSTIFSNVDDFSFSSKRH